MTALGSLVALIGRIAQWAPEELPASRTVAPLVLYWMSLGGAGIVGYRRWKGGGRKMRNIIVAIGGATAVVPMVLIMGLPWAMSACSRMAGSRDGSSPSERAVSRAMALIEDVARQSAERPVLRGESIPGSAWEDYLPALKSLHVVRGESLGHLDDYASRKETAHGRAVDVLLTQHESALDGLRRGACRCQGQYPYVWDVNGFSTEFPDIMDSQVLAYLAVGRARKLEEEGRGREAGELLLDATQFGRDLLQNGHLLSVMAGAGVCDIAFGGLRWLLRSKTLQKADLAEIVRQLDVLERGFPTSGRALFSEAAVCCVNLLRAGGIAFQTGEKEAASAVIFEAAELYVQFMDRAARIDGLSWEAALSQYREIDQAMEGSGNSLVVNSGLKPEHAGKRFREMLTFLRLLRTAACFLATSEVLALDDPFGTRILSFVDAGRARFWSVGPDGEDDHGHGGWGYRYEDIVIEVSP